MRHNLGQKQQEALLRRDANYARPTPSPARPMGGSGRVALEALVGLILGIPLGASLYYGIIAVYFQVMMGLLFATWGLCGSLHLPASSTANFEQALNFGPLVDVGLMALALVCCFYLTRGTIRQGYRVLAWVQLPLALPVVLVLFYLTLIHHKPLLPFYGQ